MTSKLFGSSGVRGIINVELTPTLAVQIGLATVTLANARKVLVARDTRTSGLMLEDAVISGSLAGGADVASLGIVPTPVLAFLTKKLHADVGIMITASHNPPQYNGIKIFNRNGMAYNEKSQDKIERIIEKHSYRFADWPDLGDPQYLDENLLYIERIKKRIKLKKKWHTVVDPGCGATYSIAPTVFKSLDCEVTTLNAQPDGFFPSRSPEPNPESLKPLTRVVKDLGADVGLGFDGDGDRVAFVDEKGIFADSDRVLAAYAAYVTRKRAGGVTVTNVEASMCIEKMVEAQGGKIIRTRVGDTYISEAMRKHKAIFGGEPCGAWIHPQYYYCPDGMLSSVLLLKALEEENKTLHEFISETPQYPMIREKIACKNEAKQGIVTKASQELESSFMKRKDRSRVDGVRLTLEDGWVLIRASGTEPLIRLTAEAESLEAAKRIMRKSMKLVRNLVEGKQK